MILKDENKAKGGGTKNQTKRVAQNTYSIKFSALQTPSICIYIVPT